jgi:hypothetical protein
MRRSDSARYCATPLRPRLAALCGLAATVLSLNTQASTIEAINHTHWAINRFSVDGQSGIDIIGPYQGGGGGVATSPRNAGNRA